MLIEAIKNIQSSKPEVRKFGFTIAVALLCVSGILFWKAQPSYLYFAIAATIFAALGSLLPLILKPIYRAWMAFAVAMGFIMTRVILTLMFYAVFTPIASIAKLLGKDLLNERIDTEAESYWIKRRQQAYEPASSERMF